LLGALIAKAAPGPGLAPRAGVLVLVAVVLGGWMYGLQRTRAYPYLLMRATEQVEEGKPDAAVPLYSEALKLHPGSSKVIHFQLARAYYRKKDFKGAEKELALVLAMDPKNQQLLNDVGTIRLELHRTDDARQSYEQLLAVNPRSAEAHAGLGAVAAAEDNCPLALKEYAQALELNPRLPEVRARQGECLLQLKRYDEAIASYRGEIAVSGDGATTERALAMAYKAKGMTAESDALLQRAEKLKSAGGQE
jgi:tetratricopeptide (TPR) repeat protein